ncbi:hypothetical protein L6452_17961 [Arctium lappa]|uniref:Uncharacterized protein n=1 Tax=Arctium lappa TaxID=4217 RepID=A0ACB9C4W0_ARCLA|nr:hypothetical protein L6452_17961 [Arctium lappa]
MVYELYSLIHSGFKSSLKCCLVDGGDSKELGGVESPMTQNMSGIWAAETSSEWEHRCPLAPFKLPDLVTVRRMLEPGEDDELPGWVGPDKGRGTD